jgi:hypothetical protein
VSPEPTFEAVGGSIDDRIDDAYRAARTARASYRGSP